MAASPKHLNSMRNRLMAMHYVPLVCFAFVGVCVEMVMCMPETVFKAAYLRGSVVLWVATGCIVALQGLAHVDFFSYWRIRYHNAVMAATKVDRTEVIGLILDNFIDSPFKTELLIDGARAGAPLSVARPGAIQWSWILRGSEVTRQLNVHACAAGGGICGCWLIRAGILRYYVFGATHPDFWRTQFNLMALFLFALGILPL